VRAFYLAIWRATWREQVVLIVLSISVAALAAVPLDYQKKIINQLGSGVDKAVLFQLCAEMMGIVILSLGLKWLLGFQQGLSGEDVIRRLRRVVVDDAAKPRDNRRNFVKSGTLANMVSSEAEEVGQFAGSAISEPLLQIGTLMSVIGYIAATQPRLGLLAILVVLPQAVIVFLTQRRVNRLVGERVIVLRDSVDIATSERVNAEVERILSDFDRIYDLRRSIFLWKLSTKFVLSAINGVGTVGVLLLGGILVIEGRSDVGTVVAATVGLSRLQQPWRQLVTFYRTVSAVRVKFELMREVLLHARHHGGRPPKGRATGGGAKRQA